MSSSKTSWLGLLASSKTAIMTAMVCVVLRLDGAVQGTCSGHQWHQWHRVLPLCLVGVGGSRG
jgi:hypothetical protein